MNNHICRCVATIQRAIQYILDHPVENALAASLLDQLKANLARIQLAARIQSLGFTTMLGASHTRQRIAESLREDMRALARVAKVLDPRAYPDAQFIMRTANLKVYTELLTRARSFIAYATPIAEVFIAHAIPADFIARMETKIAALDAAEGRKSTARGKWIGHTAGLTEHTRAAIRVLRQLQVIHANVYASDPELAAGWKAATRIERAPKRAARETIRAAKLDAAPAPLTTVLAGTPTSPTAGTYPPPSESGDPASTAAPIPPPGFSP